MKENDKQYKTERRPFLLALKCLLLLAVVSPLLWYASDWILAAPLLTALGLFLAAATVGMMNSLGLQGVFLHYDLRQAGLNGAFVGLLIFIIIFCKGLVIIGAEWTTGNLAPKDALSWMLEGMSLPLILVLLVYVLAVYLSSLMGWTLYEGRLSEGASIFCLGTVTSALLLHVLMLRYGEIWVAPLGQLPPGPWVEEGIRRLYEMGNIAPGTVKQFEATLLGHRMATALALVSGVGYILLVVVYHLPGLRGILRHLSGVPPLCLLLLALALVDGFVNYHLLLEWRIFTALLILLYLLCINCWWGHRLHPFWGFRLERELYAGPLDRRASYTSFITQGPPQATAAPDLITPRAHLENRLGGRGPDAKMVIVAVSGGGIRAALWAAHVLYWMGLRPGFSEQVGLVTGASGGILGAAHHLAATYGKGGALRGPSGDPAAELAYLRHVERESLSAPMWAMALHDVPAAFLPPLLWRGPDRGRAIEERWEDQSCGATNAPNHAPPLAAPMSLIAAAEAAGERPALLLSPMVAEDGRQALISNLDLRAMCGGVHGPTRSVQPFGATHACFELLRLFPVQATLRLSTALRMSASFPYVTPAGELPTRERTRLVDAGYYDNYGVQTAAHFIRAHHAEIQAVAPGGVILVEIRDSESSRARAGLGTRPPKASLFPALTTPLEAVMAARSAVAYQNDQLLATLESTLAPHLKLTSCVFELPEGQASLSWYLHPEEIANITEAGKEIARGLGIPDVETRLSAETTQPGEPSLALPREKVARREKATNCLRETHAEAHSQLHQTAQALAAALEAGGS